MMANRRIKQLVEQLKPYVMHPQFDEMFQKVAGSLSGPEKLKLKMELKDLTKPVNKTVDLRRRVNGVVEPYEHEGRTHYLDSVAREIFEQGLKTFRGTFTEETYQRILSAENNYRVLGDKQLQQVREQLNDSVAPVAPLTPVAEEALTPIERFTLGQYQARSEERMNFVVATKIEVLDSKGDCTCEFIALTTDISFQGVRLKFAEQLAAVAAVPANTAIAIRYVGLADEFVFDTQHREYYTLRHIEEQDQAVYWRLQRTGNENDTDSPLLSLLRTLMTGYKRRYKVDVDNVAESVRNKGHEQLWLANHSNIPLLFHQHDSGEHCVLETPANGDAIAAWLNEKNELVINALWKKPFVADALTTIKQQGGTHVTQLSFYRVSMTLRGQVKFYVIPTEQLAQKPQLKLLLGRLAQQPGAVALQQLSIANLQPLNDTSLTSLPESLLGDAEKALKQDTAARMEKLYRSMTFVGQLVTVPLTLPASDIPLNKESLMLLKPFALQRSERTKSMHRISPSFVNVRGEDRFNYRTQALIKVGDQKLLGVLKDFSVNGLRIELEAPCDVSQEQTVMVALPNMEKLSRQHRLRDMPYRCVRLAGDGRVLHLVASENAPLGHVGVQFFTDLTANNAEKLYRVKQAGLSPQLSLLVRNLYCGSALPHVLFAHGTRKQAQLDLLASSPLLTPVAAFIARNQALLVEPEKLLGGKAVVGRLFQPLKNASREARLDNQIVLIARAPYEQQKVLKFSVYSQLTEAELQAFREDLPEQTELQALLVCCSQGRAPDMDFLLDELNYVYQYQKHRARQLERQLRETPYIIEVSDITSTFAI
ncbi:hypothetical protein CWI84_06370 [Idiomarina tyrosinivorans]|uniref:PilZ domain-containing protein n=1 Tax=Idiomarina tyrosinivorans TaxID=1445662 RepID=A0A432ZQU5_9GAMM|nr:PilZ domain-containing protein [Idiomarina tyrosinivorans]RUO80253.1 hypothetical protein CWI84_06370 [Idiomarina tyrosinivorans]